MAVVKYGGYNNVIRAESHCPLYNSLREFKKYESDGGSKFTGIPKRSGCH